MASIIYDEKELMRALLEAGAHFGHQTKRWNPKMKPYIFVKRNGIHIIDLRNTMKKLKETFEAMRELVAAGGTVLFVGTKRQAQASIADEAQRASCAYISKRWLGGTLTNYANIKQSLDKMKRFEKRLEDSNEKMTKKERALLSRRVKKLQEQYEGIRDLPGIPTAMWVVDLKREFNAVAEARKLGVKLFGIADTNCDPQLLDYFVPGNDDAIRAIKVISSIMADAIIEGNSHAAQQVAEDEGDDLPPHAMEPATPEDFEATPVETDGPNI